MASSQQCVQMMKPACHSPLNQISDESIENILSYLPVPELVNDRRVCQNWQRIVSQPSLWREFIFVAADFMRGHTSYNWSFRRKAR